MRSVSGAGNGAERAENWLSGNGAVSGHTRKRLSVSVAWSGRPRSGERVSQSRLERWAANRPLVLRSHALGTYVENFLRSKIGRLYDGIYCWHTLRYEDATVESEYKLLIQLIWCYHARNVCSRKVRKSGETCFHNTWTQFCVLPHNIPDTSGQTGVHVGWSENRDKTTQSADLFDLQPRKKIIHCNLRACWGTKCQHIAWSVEIVEIFCRSTYFWSKNWKVKIRIHCEPKKNWNNLFCNDFAKHDQISMILAHLQTGRCMQLD